LSAGGVGPGDWLLEELKPAPGQKFACIRPPSLGAAAGPIPRPRKRPSQPQGNPGDACSLVSSSRTQRVVGQGDVHVAPKFRGQKDNRPHLRPLPRGLRQEFVDGRCGLACGDQFWCCGTRWLSGWGKPGMDTGGRGGFRPVYMTLAPKAEHSTIPSRGGSFKRDGSFGRSTRPLAGGPRAFRYEANVR